MKKSPTKRKPTKRVVNFQEAIESIKVLRLKGDDGNTYIWDGYDFYHLAPKQHGK